MSSMTIKALLPSPRYTGHDATESVLRNIGNILMNCIYKAVNVREGVSKKFELSNTPIKKSRLSMNTLRAAFPGRLLSRFVDIQWSSQFTGPYCSRLGTRWKWATSRFKCFIPEKSFSGTLRMEGFVNPVFCLKIWRREEGAVCLLNGLNTTRNYQR
jgi:hypothetical protein